MLLRRLVKTSYLVNSFFLKIDVKVEETEGGGSFFFLEKGIYLYDARSSHSFSLLAKYLQTERSF